MWGGKGGNPSDFPGLGEKGFGGIQGLNTQRPHPLYWDQPPRCSPGGSVLVLGELLEGEAPPGTPGPLPPSLREMSL